jgi:hypothetical protein
MRLYSFLFLIGVLAAGSTALGYYYYFFYEPPLAAAETFMKAMENKSVNILKRVVVVSDEVQPDVEELRPVTDDDVKELLKPKFHRGRILDQRKREGGTRDFHYLVYREPDGTIYALLVTKVGNDYKVVIPERRYTSKPAYLWEFSWTN